MAVSLTSVARVLDMPPTLKSVLREVCDFANDDGLFFAAVGSLMQATNLSERTVRAHMRTLERMGVLRRSADKVRVHGELVAAPVYTIDLVPAVLEFGMHDVRWRPKHWDGPTEAVAASPHPDFTEDDDPAAAAAGAAPPPENPQRADNQNIDNARENEDIPSPAAGPGRSCTPPVDNPPGGPPGGANNVEGGANAASDSGRSCTQSISNHYLTGARAREAGEPGEDGAPIAPPDERRSPDHGEPGSAGDGGDEKAVSKESIAARWRQCEDAIRKKLGNGFWLSYGQWLIPESDDDGTLVLAAPTVFDADAVNAQWTYRLARLLHRDSVRAVARDWCRAAKHRAKESAKAKGAA